MQTPAVLLKKDGSMFIVPNPEFNQEVGKGKPSINIDPLCMLAANNLDMVFTYLESYNLPLPSVEDMAHIKFRGLGKTGTRSGHILKEVNPTHKNPDPNRFSIRKLGSRFFMLIHDC